METMKIKNDATQMISALDDIVRGKNALESINAFLTGDADENLKNLAKAKLAEVMPALIPAFESLELILGE